MWVFCWICILIWKFHLLKYFKLMKSNIINHFISFTKLAVIYFISIKISWLSVKTTNRVYIILASIPCVKPEVFFCNILHTILVFVRKIFAKWKYKRFVRHIYNFWFKFTLLLINWWKVNNSVILNWDCVYWLHQFVYLRFFVINWT